VTASTRLIGASSSARRATSPSGLQRQTSRAVANTTVPSLAASTIAGLIGGVIAAVAPVR
jgi:hypothetical protein